MLLKRIVKRRIEGSYSLLRHSYLRQPTSPTNISPTTHFSDNSLLRQFTSPTTPFSDNSLLRQPTSPTTHFSDNPLLRQFTSPTVHFSDSSLLRQLTSPMLNDLTFHFCDNIHSISSFVQLFLFSVSLLKDFVELIQNPIYTY